MSRAAAVKRLSLVLWPFRLVYRGLVWLANSPRTLIFSYLLMIVISGVIYSIVEHRSAGDSVWWAVVTASTVGYGDISPVTPVGRLLAGLLISTMVLLVIPLITAHFASKLIVDQDAFRHEEQEELKNNLRMVRRLLEELAARDGVAAFAARDDVAAPAPVSGADSAGPSPAPSDRSGTRSPSR